MTSTRVPRRGERVCVEGHPGTFVVVRVDKVNSIAKVELWDDPTLALRNIAFDAIHLIHATVSEAA